MSDPVEADTGEPERVIAAGTVAAEEIGEGWQRTHPLAVFAGGLQGLQKSILPIVAVLFGSQAMNGADWAVPLIIALIIIVNLGTAYLAWRRLRYHVGTSDIRVEKGLISRSARSVPYERIQDVSLEQSPIPRLLGLVEVRFETGAGGKDELKLAYVDMEEGERLREVVRDLRDGAPAAPATIAAGEQARPEPESGQLLFSMGPRRLLLFGLFSFSLVAIAVLGGAAQQFDFLLPFDLWDFDWWEERLAGPGSWLVGLGWTARIIGAIFAVFMLLLVGIVTGVVRTFLRDWDFRLEQTAKGFRRRRGLLTKTDVVMPVHRVQAIIIRTGLMRRLWGWHGLSFVSLAQDAKSANHDVAPFARMAEIAPIVRAAHFTLPDKNTDWHRPSRKYRTDAALLCAAPVALAGLAALVFLPLIWPGLILVLIAAMLVLRQHYLWLYECHAVDDSQVLSRRGWLIPKLEVANRVKLHSVEIAQGPIAKRRGYADLRFGLAGGSFAFNGLPVEEAEAMRAAALGSIAEVDFSALPR